jgi:hypothetical protein
MSGEGLQLQPAGDGNPIGLGERPTSLNLVKGVRLFLAGDGENHTVSRIKLP